MPAAIFFHVTNLITSMSDTGYVHFNVSRSLPEKSSTDLGATDTHTTRSFSKSSLLLFDFVIMPL